MMFRAHLLYASLLLLTGLASLASADEPYKVEFTISAGNHNRMNTPMSVQLQVPKAYKDASLARLETDGKGAVQRLAQVDAPGIFATAAKSKDGMVTRELNLVITKLAAGTSTKVTAQIGGSFVDAKVAAFDLRDTTGEYSELVFGNQPVLRYMNAKIDESSKEAREKTYKVFHHWYDPTGKLLVTKGPGSQYTHHRGLFYGFNRITYGDNKKADTWHCSGDAHLSDEGVLQVDLGPVLGRHRVAVDWHGVGKEVFAKEQRELTAYVLPAGTLVEARSRLSTNGEPVQLDGDPQHAGFQFRAAAEVGEKNAKQTYYLRPDGVGKPGETINWEPKSQKGPVDLPWDAMSFVIGDQRYTVARIDHPKNPHPQRFSERDYGRFGSYFQYALDKENPLQVRYRFWLQNGEMTGDQVAALAADFSDPPTVEVH